MIEDAIEDKLNTRHFSLLSDDKPKMSKAAPKSLRFGGNQKATIANGKTPNSASRLIVFVLGGMTFSEMRCAYEVSKASQSGCEVIIGMLFV